MDLSGGLAFLENTRLKRLYIYGCRKADVSGIKQLGLKELKIEKAKNIHTHPTGFLKKMLERPV